MVKMAAKKPRRRRADWRPNDRGLYSLRFISDRKEASEDMWNPKETETSGAEPKPTSRETPLATTAPPREVQATPEKPGGIAKIGSSIRIKGELSGDEDLLVEGRVDGQIDLKKNSVTIGPSARLKAEVSAKAVVVQGQVTGDVTANDKIELTETSKVQGDVNAPRVVIADGARFKGSVNTYGDQDETARKKASQETGKAKKTVATPDAVDRPVHAGVSP
jgi:cytoskeletal protein CcmA (bactofilin family)